MLILEKNADGTPTRFRMRRGAELHHHFRSTDSAAFQIVTPMVRRRFAYALAMPNLEPPITTYSAMSEYSSALAKSLGDCVPLLTLYLTDTLDLNEVEKCCEHPGFVGVKYYPKGLTNNSDRGITDPAALWTPGSKPYEVLRILEEHKKALFLHAADGFDKHGNELDPYEQEPHFIRETLPRIRQACPTLKISVEHLSTTEGATYLRNNGGEYLGCSLTAHHLLLARRDVFRGGYNVHRSWMPAIQSDEHREALRELAKADLPFVWLGTDSAPHPRTKKEAACCASGVMTVHAGIELYVEAFEDMGALDDRFERFASINGPRFFGLEPSRKTLTLLREEWKVERPFSCFVPPEVNKTGVEEIIPFRMGETIRWKLAA